MVKASRTLLSAVTRLLIVADMIDVNRLLRSIHLVKNELEMIKNASNQIQVDEAHRRFKINTDDLINQAAKRQYELKDTRLREDLAAARAVLKKNSMLLLTASKVFVRHPELKVSGAAFLRRLRKKLIRLCCFVLSIAGGPRESRLHLQANLRGRRDN